MSRIVPDSVQKHVLSNISNVVVTDTWLYWISRSWIEKYQERFTGHIESVQTITPDVVQTLDKDIVQACEPVSPLYTDQDVNLNQLVSEKWWKILVSWFGVRSGCCIIRRPIHSKYIQIANGVDHHSVLAKCESDLLMIDITLLSDVERNSNECVLIYAWDSFDFLEHQIRRKFCISPKSQCRLWIYIKVNGNQVILDTIRECREPVIAKIAKHVSWLFKVICDRDRQVIEGQLNNDPFYLDKHNTRLCVAIEELGIEREYRKVLSNSCVESSLELECESASIVTLATIDSDWDQHFTECLDELTKEISELATDRKRDLIDTAREIVNQKLTATDHLKRKLEERIDILGVKEEKLADRERQVTEREEELQRKLSQYKEGLDAFMKEKSRIETEWRRVQEQNIIQNSQVTLDIGGVSFNTSLSTITSIEGSLFVDLFCGTRVIKPSGNGSYFFDRDGTHFRHILNYLRNGSNAVSSFPKHDSVLHEILNEARYYILPELEHLIQERIESVSLSSLIVDDMEIVSHSSLASK